MKKKAGKSVANAPKSDGSANFGFLSVPAQAGTFNSAKADTDGKKKK